MAIDKLPTGCTSFLPSCTLHAYHPSTYPIHIRQRWNWNIWGNRKTLCQCQGADGAVLHRRSARIGSRYSRWVPAEMTRSLELRGKNLWRAQCLQVPWTQCEIEHIVIFSHSMYCWCLWDHPCINRIEQCLIVLMTLYQPTLWAVMYMHPFVLMILYQS